MAGIYIHIPFCKQACHYCNFHFSTSLRYKPELIAAIVKEIALTRASQAKDPAEVIETIYFGGGTPSLCNIEELQNILDSIRSSYLVSPDAEITLEANPDDITSEKLAAWKIIGINRLSIGVQSFFEEDLQWMNRAHNSSQAVDALELAAREFNNITIDLIYGTPQLTHEKWKQNVDIALALGIPHLSCYALTVEPKTPLDKMILRHTSPDINPDQQSEQFFLLMQWLSEAGYEHYEISNFARPGYRSRHNSSYWQGKNYYGFGPSAHSFDGISRWWNIANNNQYIQSIQKDILPVEKEVLTPVQRINEHIMISLRTSEGLDLDSLPVDSPSVLSREEIVDQLIKKSGKFIDQGWMVRQNNWLCLTNQGKLLADGIAADLFLD